MPYLIEHANPLDPTTNLLQALTAIGFLALDTTRSNPEGVGATGRVVFGVWASPAAAQAGGQMAGQIEAALGQNFGTAENPKIFADFTTMRADPVAGPALAALQGYLEAEAVRVIPALAGAIKI